jgi:ACS family glucarate transporter-like MFS transporter
MKAKLPFRILLVLFTFILTVILYVDRACISTAKQSIMADLELTVTQFGWVMAVFTLGYALFQAPSGLWADKYGPRIVLSGIVAVWSVLTAFTGLTWNYLSMLITRFLFGAGEAGAFPALSKVSFNWYPLKERGIVQGINFSGSRLGAAVAMPLVALLITSIGWRHTFLLFGVLGVVYAVFWYMLFRNKPEESKLVSAAEMDYIVKNRQQISTNAEKSLSFKSILSSPNVWLAMGQYVSSNFTFFFTLTWMYPFIQGKFDIDPVEAGLYASIPLIAGAFGNWVSGFLVDFIYKKGKIRLSRSLPAIVGFVLAASGMFMVTISDSMVVSVVWMAMAVFGADMTLSPSWSFCIDIGKEHSGTVSGIMNMAGNLGAFITVIAYPYLFKWTGSNVPFFITCSILSLLAVVMWFFMNPEKTISNRKK